MNGGVKVFTREEWNALTDEEYEAVLEAEALEIERLKEEEAAIEEEIADRLERGEIYDPEIEFCTIYYR
jgi:ribosome-binding factor A